MTGIEKPKMKACPMKFCNSNAQNWRCVGADCMWWVKDIDASNIDNGKCVMQYIEHLRRL